MHGAYYRNSIFGNSYTGLYMGSLKPWGGGLNVAFFSVSHRKQQTQHFVLHCKCLMYSM